MTGPSKQPESEDSTASSEVGSTQPEAKPEPPSEPTETAAQKSASAEQSAPAEKPTAPGMPYAESIAEPTPAQPKAVSGESPTPPTDSTTAVGPSSSTEPTQPVAAPTPPIALEPPAMASVPPRPAADATTIDQTQPIPGTQRPRGSRRTLVIVLALLGVLLLLICAVMGFFFYSDYKQDQDHKAGKCVAQDGNVAKPVACDKPEAYKIIKRINNTTSDNGCPATETELYYVNKSDKYVLCLKRNNPITERS